MNDFPSGTRRITTTLINYVIQASTTVKRSVNCLIIQIMCIDSELVSDVMVHNFNKISIWCSKNVVLHGHTTF